MRAQDSAETSGLAAIVFLIRIKRKVASLHVLEIFLPPKCTVIFLSKKNKVFHYFFCLWGA